MIEKRILLSGFIIALLLVCFPSREQDTACYIILEKGTAGVVFVNGKSRLAFRIEQRGILPSTGTLTLSPGSDALVYSKNGSMEVGGNTEEKYQLSTLISILKNKSGTKEFSRFYEFLNHTYREMKETEKLNGSVAAAAGRSICETGFFFSPNDSSVVISDSVDLAWGPADLFRLSDNLLIINASKRDTLYNGKPGTSSLLLPGLKEGEYHWLSTIKSKEGKIFTMDNVFYVPSIPNRFSLAEDFVLFKQAVSSFSSVFKDILLKEYIRQNKIYSLHSSD